MLVLVKIALALVVTLLAFVVVAFVLKAVVVLALIGAAAFAGLFAANFVRAFYHRLRAAAPAAGPTQVLLP